MTPTADRSHRRDAPLGRRGAGYGAAVDEGLRRALTLVEEVGPLVAKSADEAERIGRLTDEVVGAFHDSGLLRILVPVEMGGLGLTIPESVQLYRSMSAYDASAGWLLAILGNGPLFGMFVAPPVFEEIFGPGRAVMAGSLNPLGGRADPLPGGFRFSGRATTVSGCRHATWLMAGAWVHRDGDKSWIGGHPEMIAGLLPMAAVTIEDTWVTTGMRATGSDDCRYADVVVPEERTFPWPEPAAQWDAGPAANIPMHAQLGSGIAATIVGAARGAQERFVELAATKRPTANTTVLAERAFAQMAVGDGTGLLLAAEDTLRTGTEIIWSRAERNEPFDDTARLDLRLRMVTACRLSLRAVDMLVDAPA